MNSPWRTLTLTIFSLAYMFLFNIEPSGALTIKEGIEKVNDVSWIKETLITTGYVVSICSYQSLNGITEGYHFSQETKHIATKDNYHAFKTGRDIAGITTGIFTYAQFKDSRKTFWGRSRRVIGGALLARNMFEWSYKAQRYGDPFDYSEEHNAHAVVYFTIKNGALVDMYIGTGPVTGPIVDIAVATLGILLLK